MKARMATMLSSREQRILKAIVHLYITTVEPVASRTISRRYRMDLSPATIRHVMGDLEGLGYLSQPHTSAGRVPTDKGYRFYVDSVLQVPVLPKAQSSQIDASYRTAPARDVGNLLDMTSQILASLTHQAALVLFPRLAAVVLAHLEFDRRPRHRARRRSFPTRTKRHQSLCGARVCRPDADGDSLTAHPADGAGSGAV